MQINTSSTAEVNRSIFRANPIHSYTKLSNALLQDSRLSYDTRGLIADMLSRPDDWEVTAASIIEVGTAGRDKVYRMLSEAAKFGYVQPIKCRNRDGLYTKHAYAVSDDPKLLIEKTATEIYALENPLTEKPEVDAIEPLTEKPEVGVFKPFPGKPEVDRVVVPFPGKPEVEKTVGQQHISGKSDPLPEKPDDPLPENPLHKKERKKESKEGRRVITKDSTCLPNNGRVDEKSAPERVRLAAAAIAIGMAAASPLPAVADLLSPPPPSTSASGTAEPQSPPAEPKLGYSRLAVDWFLPRAWGQWSVHNCKRDADWVRAQSAKFKEYWLSVPDSKGLKKNWERTWQNWCRNALVREAKFDKPKAKTGGNYSFSGHYNGERL